MKEKPNKLRQKDIDARWTKKNFITYFGYKNHLKADVKTKLIEEYIVTNAAVHDSQVTEELLTEKDEGMPDFLNVESGILIRMRISPKAKIILL